MAAPHENLSFAHTLMSSTKLTTFIVFQVICMTQLEIKPSLLAFVAHAEATAQSSSLCTILEIQN